MSLTFHSSKITDVIMRAWMRRGWFARLMWPLAQLFSIVIKLRSVLYQRGWLAQYKLAVPVIVVGNIFVGGTGKTPFTLWLLEQLKSVGYHPAVISRGYGRNQKTPCIVDAASLASEVGDEPLLLAQRGACPVVVGSNRVDAGRFLLRNFPNVNVIIADDGLQHLALARDVEIMLFDNRGVGNGWLIPAGPLREPITRRRDITVANISVDKKISDELPKDTMRMQLSGKRAWPLLDERFSPVAGAYKELCSLSPELAIVAAAGIGNPNRFFEMLRSQGVRCKALPLPDHFNYSNNPFKYVTADMILITEKDAVKCRQFDDLANDPRIWVVPVEVEMESNMLGNVLKKIKK